VQVYDELQLEFPVVVLLYVLFKGYTLLLKWVSFQLADETYVHDVILEGLVGQLQLPEGVNDNAKDDLDQDDRHYQDEAHVEQELFDLHGVVDADLGRVRAWQPDTVVQVEGDAGEDVHAVVLGPRKQPVVHVVGLGEQPGIPKVHEPDQRERVCDDEGEHQRQ